MFLGAGGTRNAVGPGSFGFSPHRWRVWFGSGDPWHSFASPPRVNSRFWASCGWAGQLSAYGPPLVILWGKGLWGFCGWSFCWSFGWLEIPCMIARSKE